MTTYSYDAGGNRIQEIRDAGGMNLRTQWSYDARGHVASLQDPNNHVSSYGYDAFGNRNAVTDAEGHLTSFAYDMLGNKTQTTDANGHILLYGPYDAMNHLLAETDPLGYVTQYGYDAMGNRIQLRRQVTQAPDSYETTRYQYDLRNRMVTEIRDPGGLNLTSQTGYDGNNNRISLTDPRDKLSQYSYDAQNRLTMVTDALGNTSQTRYDSVGNRTCTIDANQHYTFYDYDAINRESKSSQKIGVQECKTGDTDDIVSRSFYDSGAAMACSPVPGSPACSGPTPGSSHIAYSIGPDGKYSYFKYDNADRVWITIRKVADTADNCDANDWCRYSRYDAAGNLTARTDANGNQSTYAYYDNNWRRNEANALNETTTYTYDGVGKLKTVHTPGDNLITNTYNSRDELIQVDDKIGRVQSLNYDGVGNRTQNCDGNHHCSAYGYDAVNRLLTDTDALGNTTRHAYNAAGNLLSTNDRLGNLSCYQYDDLNRRALTIQLGASGGSCPATPGASDRWTASHYDAVGNVLSLTSAKQGSTPAQCEAGSPPADCETTRYGYDEVNRVIQETYPDAGMRLFAYDRAGNLIQRTDQQGRTTDYVYNDLYYLLTRNYQSDPDDSFSYDTGGRMLSAQRAGWLDTFSYDAADRVLQATQDGQTLSYAYDTANRCRSLGYPGGKTVAECRNFREQLTEINGGALAEYSYDLGDRVLSRGYGNATTANYSYNDNDWLTSVSHTQAGPTLFAGFSYNYDQEGNRQYEQKQHDAAHSEGYAYDNLYRLVHYSLGALDLSGTVPLPLTQTQYDLDRLGNWDDKIKDGVTQTRRHNAVNEITLINGAPLGYDGNGNLTQDSNGYSYGYDQENRLTSVGFIGPSGPETAGTYRYDALSRRVVKTAGLHRGNSESHYFYDGSRLIETQNAAAVTQAAYVYGNYIDEVLSMDRGLQTYYFHQNASSSVVAVTDSLGNVVERYGYDAYGQPTVSDGLGNVLTNSWGTSRSGIGNPWLFTGRQFDQESGLYYYRARYYDSWKGRFLQRDPEGYADRMNLYEYTRGNPLNYVDPFGATEFKVWTNWYGYAYAGRSNWGIKQWQFKRFVQAKFIYDLDITKVKLELAGPGSENIWNPSSEIWTKTASWWGWGNYDKFSAKAEGWRVRKIDCAQKRCGVEVGYKGQIDSGSITITHAAPVIKIGGKVGGDEGKPGAEVGIEIPTGPSIAKTTGGIHYDATWRLQLCPDGAGDFLVTPGQPDPKDGTSVRKFDDGATQISVFYGHSKNGANLVGGQENED